MEKLESLKEFILERKYLIILGGVVLLLLLIGSIYLVNVTNDNGNEVVLDDNLLEEKTIVEEEVVCKAKVDIKGEVEKPGLYETSCEARVLDVINLAGGITDKADTSIINLSKKVIDEMVIVILSKDEVKSYEEEKEKLEKKIEKCSESIRNDACLKKEDIYINDNDTIDINTSEDDEIIGDTPVNSLISINNATIEELMTLSGIGKTKAENIISYREENGGFKSLEELKNVNGIGDSTFEKIKNNITL